MPTTRGRFGLLRFARPIDDRCMRCACGEATRPNRQTSLGVAQGFWLGE